MRSRAAVAALAVAALVGGAAVAIAAAADERRMAFTLSVRPQQVVAVVPPGSRACQGRIDVEAAFDSIELLYGTFARPGPPLEVEVRESVTGRWVARGTQPAGYADNKPAVARLERGVPEDPTVDICLRNVGRHRVALYGGPREDFGPSDAQVQHRPVPGDIRMTFLREPPRSALSLVPDVFRRASVFRPALVGPWTFWVLLAAVALGVPALLAMALRRALADDR